jgi:DNA-binding transcriptional MerR regulator
MQIGALARLSGVTPSTIRFYERSGLLAEPQRTPGGYRDYPPEAAEDLRFIAKAQASGLKLTDIREVMEIAAGGRPPCEHVRATVTARLAEVERRVRELRALRTALSATLERLDRAPIPQGGCRCGAIELAEITHAPGRPQGRARAARA